MARLWPGKEDGATSTLQCVCVVIDAIALRGEVQRGQQGIRCGQLRSLARLHPAMGCSKEVCDEVGLSGETQSSTAQLDLRNGASAAQGAGRAGDGAAARSAA